MILSFNLPYLSSIHLSIHPFVQQVFIECLLCARHYAQCTAMKTQAGSSVVYGVRGGFIGKGEGAGEGRY